MAILRTTDNRQFTSYSLALSPGIKRQMFRWANQFNICCFMDNHMYLEKHHGYECLVAAGAWKWISLSAGNAFASLQAFAAHQNDWMFGHFGFELKQETENVKSLLSDPVGFP